MKLLEIQTRKTRFQINLDNVSMWCVDTDGVRPTFDIWFVGDTSPFRTFLSKGTQEATVLSRVKTALIPLMEGRQGTVLGCSLTLDLKDLQDAPSASQF